MWLVNGPDKNGPLNVLLIDRRGDEALQNAADAADFFAGFVSDMRGGEGGHWKMIGN